MVRGTDERGEKLKKSRTGVPGFLESNNTHQQPASARGAPRVMAHQTRGARFRNAICVAVIHARAMDSSRTRGPEHFIGHSLEDTRNTMSPRTRALPFNIPFVRTPLFFCLFFSRRAAAQVHVCVLQP